MSGERIIQKYIGFILMLIMSLGPMYAEAQDLSGKITDAQGNEISYVQIGVNETSIYTLSDAQGRFSVNLPSSAQSKRLTFLAPGFLTVSHSIDSLLRLEIVVITLQKDIREISGTVVRSPKVKKRVKGNRGPVVGSAQLSLNETGTAYGILREVPGKRAILTSISVNVNNDWLMKFTVRPFVYRVLDGEIDYQNNLIRENKVFEFEKKRGWIKMDINDLDLEVSDKIVFGVEWLDAQGPDFAPELAMTSISLTLMGGGNSYEKRGLQPMERYKWMGSFSIKGSFEFY